MCVIAIIPQKQTLSDNTISSMYRHNPDGCGMAWVSKGKLRTVKGLWSLEKTLLIYRAVEEVAETDIVLHFRIGTHGDIKSVFNCHPFRLSDNAVMFHNGIVDMPMFSDEDKSDTWHFANFLKTISLANVDNVGQKIREDSQFISQIEKWHGRHNRLCFLTDSGEAVITGTWNIFSDGVKFSNMAWVKSDNPTKKKNKKSSSQGDDTTVLKLIDEIKEEHTKSIANAKNDFDDWRDKMNPNNDSALSNSDLFIEDGDISFEIEDMSGLAVYDGDVNSESSELICLGS